MKFVCVCDGGNVRSRAMAYVLHDILGHEAIPVGRRWASVATIRMLCEWADIVIVMMPHMTASIPDQFRRKVRVVDVGEDTYGLRLDPHLMKLCGDGAKTILDGIFLDALPTCV